MSGNTNTWSSTAPQTDLAAHLSNLSVDDYSSPPRSTPGTNPPTYANVHTPPRPAFAAYDGSGQYLYYVAAAGNTLDPVTFSPQHYPFELGTPLQSQPSGMAYDPYPSPSENCGHHGDARPIPTPFPQQGSLVLSNTRANQAYRPPHMVQQQLRDLQDLSAAQQQQVFAYGQRSPYWTPPHAIPERQLGSMSAAVVMTPTNSRQPNNRMGAGGPRGRNNSGQHSHMPSQLSAFPDPQSPFASIASYTNAYGLQTPLTPALTGAAQAYPFPATYGAPYSPTPIHFGGFVAGGKRGRHGQIEDPGVVRSQRLEDFRQRKSTRMEFADIYGNICEFAGDQHGSRFIQNKLETASPEERAKVFDEIMPNAYQLMTDVFGNYVIQKLFEHGDQQQKAALAKKMEGHVLQLSMQMYGCRVMQKALEHLLLLEQREKLVGELNGHIIDCVKSSNANHVIQRLISLDPPKDVTDAFIGHVQDLSTHPFGCRVLQKSFEVLEPIKIRPLLDEMHECVLKLMMDQFGNYVVQSVLTSIPGREADRDRVIGAMKGRLFELSRHKFASNVVERAIRHAKREDKRAIIAEMMGDGPEDGETRVGTLLRDGFGNFTVQTALNEADRDQRDQLLAIIVPLMPHLRHSPCGRRLEAKLQEFEAKGILPSSLSTSATSSTKSSDLKDAATTDGGWDTGDKLAVPNGKGIDLRRVASSASSQDEQLVLKALLT